MCVCVYLNGWDVRKTGQILWVCNRGDELDGPHDGAGGAPVGMGTRHAGTGGTGGVGVVEGRHWEGPRVTRVGMLHGEIGKEER